MDSGLQGALYSADVTYKIREPVQTVLAFGSVRLGLTPSTTQVVSPQAFLRLSETSPHLITRSRYIPPRLGDRSFGGFEVKTIVPIGPGIRERTA